MMDFLIYSGWNINIFISKFLLEFRLKNVFLAGNHLLITEFQIIKSTTFWDVTIVQSGASLLTFRSDMLLSSSR
jgi:hypothetical protein